MNRTSKEKSCDLCEQEIDSVMDGPQIIECDDGKMYLCHSCMEKAIQYYKEKKTPIAFHTTKKIFLDFEKKDKVE